MEERVVGNRFELRALAGAGGMGEVWRAYDRTTGEEVAVKLLRDHRRELVERFSREARVLAELRHPSIVRYVAHGTTPDAMHYIAMEWLQGVDLSALLGERTLRVGEAVAIVARAAEALSAAHRRGLVHRDVKPGNLFVVDRDVGRVKVLDFGIVHHGELTPLTRTGMPVGTPAYMAPEQARGTKEVDARVDVFALGCVLFRCLCGRPPFMGDDVRSVLAKILFEEAPLASTMREDIPPALDALVARMLAKEPNDRPRDAAEVVDALSALGPLDRPRRISSLIPVPALGAREQRVLSIVLATGAPQSEISRLRDVIGAHGGGLERLLDGSLAVTLVGDGSGGDEVTKAARCALAILAVAPGAAIAVATGRGTLDDRLPYGEVVDRAARLLRESSGEIQLDDASAALLEGRFEVTTTGAQRVLLNEQDVGTAARTLLGRPTPFVGRAREISMLSSIFDECVSESVARAVVVTAAPGVGKSRLRHELLRRLEGSAKPPAIWSARGDPIAAGSPFLLVAQLLRRAIGVRGHEGDDEIARRLRARVEEHVAANDVDRVVEFLGVPLGLRDVPTSVPLRAARTDAIVMHEQIRRAWVDFVAAVSTAAPLLVVLEDLHWGDLPSIKLLDAALDALHHRPWMLLALARPEVHDAFPQLWAGRATTEVRLDVLTGRAAEALVREVLRDAPPELVAALVEKAAGNAYFLEELIRVAAEGGEVRLPDTVFAILDARLQKLDPEARRILRAASIFGTTFWRSGVASLVGDGQARRVDEWLPVLREQELVVRRSESRFAKEQEWVFRHALVRDAAYETLTDEDRALGHRLAAEWLERAGERDAMTLAEHFERAGEGARAVPWFHLAAEQALEGNDLRAAIARAERGVESGARGEIVGALRCVQAEAYHWQGEMRLAADAAREAMRHLPEGGRLWHHAFVYAAVAASKTADVEALVSSIDVLRPGRSDDAPHVVACLALSAFLTSVGRTSEGRSVLAAVESAARRMEDDPIVGYRLHQAFTFLTYADGDTVGVLRHTAAAASHCDRGGRTREGLVQRTNHAEALNLLGRWSEAVDVARSCLEPARRLRMNESVAFALTEMGLALGRLGRTQEAIAAHEEAIAAVGADGDRWLATTARMYLAQTCLRAADADRAQTVALEAAASARTAYPMEHAQSLSVVAFARLALGDAKGALEAARAAMDGLTPCAVEGEIRLAFVEALRANGATDEARAAAKVARDHLMARAAKITDPEWRRRFLDDVPEHARTLALARELDV